MLPMVVTCYVLTQMQVFDNFAGLPHRRANEVEDQDKMKNRKLKIDFYGGSITYGKGMKDLNNKRYSTIVGEKLDVNVLNKGVVAAGVSRHITCGISKTDILVSEFRINEFSPGRLKQWYKLACTKAKHVVVLDLWSWLSPPGGEDSLTIEVMEKVRNDPLCARTTFSVLSMVHLDQNRWQCLVPSFFKPAEPDEASEPLVPERCFELLDTTGCDEPAEQDESESPKFQTLKHRSRELAKVWKGCDAMLDESRCSHLLNMFKLSGSRELGKMTIGHCKALHANAMQHGLVAYHERIANLFEEHMKEEVLPNLEARDSMTNEMQVAGKNTSATDAECYGHWGDNEKLWGDDLNLTSGFQLTSLSGRKEKITINSGTVGSSVVLDCPSEFNFISFYYVGHTWINETVQMLVESQSYVSKAYNRTIKTQIRADSPLPYRLLRNTELFNTPITVTLIDKNPNAILEIALTACSN